jgi:hypothetical protein
MLSRMNSSRPRFELILPERNVRGIPLALLKDRALERWRRKLAKEITSSLPKIREQCFWNTVHDYALVEFELRARGLWPHMPLGPNEGVPVRRAPPPSLSTSGVLAPGRAPRG